MKHVLIAQNHPAKAPYLAFAQEYGLTMHFHPFIHLTPIAHTPLDPATYDVVLFTSRYAITAFFSTLSTSSSSSSSSYALPTTTPCVCLTPALADHLRTFSPQQAIAPFPTIDREAAGHVYTAPYMLSLLRPYLSTTSSTTAAIRCLYPCSQARQPTLAAALRAAAIACTEWVLYTPTPADLRDLTLCSGMLVAFYSPSAVKALFTQQPSCFSSIYVAVIGPTTEAAVRSYGGTVHVRPDAPTSAAMIHAMKKFLAKGEACK